MESDGEFFFSEEVLPSLLRWFATFPVLKQVSLEKNCLPGDTERRSGVVKAIKVACPLVQDVMVDGILVIH